MYKIRIKIKLEKINNGGISGCSWVCGGGAMRLWWQHQAGSVRVDRLSAYPLKGGGSRIHVTGYNAAPGGDTRMHPTGKGMFPREYPRRRRN